MHDQTARKCTCFVTGPLLSLPFVCHMHYYTLTSKHMQSPGLGDKEVSISLASTPSEQQCTSHYICKTNVKLWGTEFLLRRQNLIPTHCRISWSVMNNWGGNQGSLRNAIFSASGFGCSSGSPRLIPPPLKGRRSPTSRWVANHKPLWCRNFFAMTSVESDKLERERQNTGL